jgi:DNA-binding NtrC family response regulator
MKSESADLLLNGKTVLIVEDEAIISFMLEDMMVDLGAGKMFHAATITEALAAIEARAPQVAILDLNLGGEFSYPVAERLESLGIPFLFTTGYGRVEERWSSHSIVQKPFELAAIAGALRKALAM